MRIAEESPLNKIQSLDETQLTLQNQAWPLPVIVTHEGSPTPWAVEDFNCIDSQGILALIDTGAEVILIGTGKESKTPSNDLLRVIASHGVSIECMGNHPAARTFNVLSAEGRHVAVGFTK